MKQINIITVLLFAFFSILFSSCQKELLDEIGPLNQISDKDIFKSASTIEAAVNGVYDAAQSGFYISGVIRGYPFGAAYVEQGDMRGEDMTNLATFYRITHQSTYDANTANNVYMWHTLYALINKANIVKEGVEASGTVLDDSKKNAYVGECLFLRALAHHELVIMYCRPYANGGNDAGVFYRDFAINTEDAIIKAGAVTRSTVKNTYDKILADLDAAENLLPVGKGTEPYRASKAAAIALKMRVKLHMQDWTGVISEGAKLVEASGVASPSSVGSYSLASTLSALYGSSALGSSTESIFYIRNSSTDNPGVNGALASMYTSSSRSGRSLVGVSPIIYTDSNWISTDLRKTTLVVDGASGSIKPKFIDKYKDVVNKSDASPIIRYAEVLLSLAEAECRSTQSVSARALQLLNAVRNRAVTTEKDQYTTASFADWKDMVKKILMERRIEFLGEGKRWADIHRTCLEVDFRTGNGGIPAKVTESYSNTDAYTKKRSEIVTGIAEIPYEDKRFIWPIPLDEVQQNPNQGIQNPDY